MVPIFIASNAGYSGKTLVALCLAMNLRERGYKVAYMKPLGKAPVRRGMNVFDADAVFVKEVLNLPDPLETISPFVLSYEKQSLLLKGELKNARKDVMNAFRVLGEKDFILIEGAADLFEGAMLGIDAISLIDGMKARTLAVEPWRGDSSIDSLFGMQGLLGDSFIGGVLNKVPQETFCYIKETVKPFLEKKGTKIFGTFQKDSLLESLTVAQLNEMLNGKVLCCEDRMGESVENFSIGAMDVDSALNYFRRIPNKAVITGAHRSDIQLAAMETSTKCIILTGGLYTNDVVLGKAQVEGIPIISVSEDTFATVDRIEAVIGKTHLRDKGKMDRAREIFEREFDIKRFLRNL